MVVDSVVFRVKLAICMWLLVKLPAFRSWKPSDWSLRLLFACDV